jgi:hypothetical protein
VYDRGEGEGDEKKKKNIKGNNPLKEPGQSLMIKSKNNQDQKTLKT